MKQQIQLYINGQRVDLFSDETIEVTSSIQNVKDIAKVFTDFSQSFSIPASQANNKIFQHYYSPDVLITDTSGFDARFLADAVIEINYQPFRTGKIKLDSVDLKNNAPYAYKITFFGSTIELKDLLGDDKLDGLNWLSNFDLIHNLNNVATYLENGYDVTVGSTVYFDSIITPLISAEKRWFYDTSKNESGSGNLQTMSSALRGAYFKDLKYAIRLYVIIKAIENTYTIENGYPTNLVFSDDFFNPSNTDFYNLYMWLHREKGRFQSESISTYLNKMPVQNFSGVYMNPDNFSIFDIFSFSAQSYAFTLNINVSSSAANFNIFLERDGSVVESKIGNTGATSYSLVFADLTNNGNYKIRIEYTTGFNVQSTTSIDMIRKSVSGNTSETFDFTAQQVLSTDSLFSIVDNIPEMKVIDFLTGIFKMFNLTAYQDAGQIVVKPLDSFYIDGGVYDITEYVDVSNSSVSPLTLFKNIDFKYEGLQTLLAEKHKEAFNLEWGVEEYAIEDKFDGETYSVVIPFEHMKFERIYNEDNGAVTSIQWGWMVDKLNDDGSASPYIGKPLLFYPVSITGTSIRIYNDTSFFEKSKYYIPSNSKFVSNPADKSNIHFKAELNEYDNIVYNSTLFNDYYSNYISNIFDPQSRILNVSAYLPNKILTKYRLNDKFIIGDSIYNINSVKSDLTTGKSDIELITLIDITTTIAPTTTSTTTTTTTTTSTTTTTTTTTTTSTTSSVPDSVFEVRRESDSFYTFAQYDGAYTVDDTVSLSNDGSGCYIIVAVDTVPDSSIYPTITGACTTTSTTTTPPSSFTAYQIFYDADSELAACAGETASATVYSLCDPITLIGEGACYLYNTQNITDFVAGGYYKDMTTGDYYYVEGDGNGLVQEIGTCAVTTLPTTTENPQCHELAISSQYTTSTGICSVTPNTNTIWYYGTNAAIPEVGDTAYRNDDNCTGAYVPAGYYRIFTTGDYWIQVQSGGYIAQVVECTA